MRNEAFFGEITRINISLLQDIHILLQSMPSKEERGDYILIKSGRFCIFDAG